MPVGFNLLTGMCRDVSELFGKSLSEFWKAYNVQKKCLPI